MLFDTERRARHVDTQAVPDAVGQASSDGRRARILLADDDDNVRGLFERLLTLQGWDVVVARNGREAVEAWPEEGTPFDLVILDMNMPEMTGAAAYEELHRRHPEMVALFVSGYMEEEYWRDVIVQGKVPFLAKPFTPQQLITTVTALLAHGNDRAVSRCLQPERDEARQVIGVAV